MFIFLDQKIAYVLIITVNILLQFYVVVYVGWFCKSTKCGHILPGEVKLITAHEACAP